MYPPFVVTVFVHINILYTVWLICWRWLNCLIKWSSIWSINSSNWEQTTGYPSGFISLLRYSLNYLGIIPTSRSLEKKPMPRGKNMETTQRLKGINRYRLGILKNILKPLRGWAIPSLFKEEHWSKIIWVQEKVRWVSLPLLRKEDLSA